MSTLRQHYSPEEIAKRGDEIYEGSIRSQIEPYHQGEIVAIDIETGAFVIGKTSVVASGLLRAKRPDAEVWLVRVGHRAVHRIGFQLYATPRCCPVSAAGMFLSIDYRGL